MSDKANDCGGYIVGHGKPPQHSRWPKGTSGNPKGRPPKPKPDAASVVAILNAPVDVRKGGKVKKLHAFEAIVRRLASRAIAHANMQSARRFIELCEQYGVITPAPESWRNNMLLLPATLTEAEWKTNVENARADLMARRA
jgi:Family of unknown function (DUF5681)